MAATEGIYRRVSVRLWSDEKVGRLTPLLPSGQALWVYLLTGPHTGPIPGVFVAGRAALSEALGWELEEFDRCAAELLREGLVRFDRASRIWFIPNALRHNQPANPNVVTSWRTAWTMLPEGAMREEIGDAILSTLEGLSKACAEAFEKACPKPSAKALPNPSRNDPPAPSPAPLPKQEQETGSRKQEDLPGFAGSAKAAANEMPPQISDQSPLNIWDIGIALLVKTGKNEKSARTALGLLRKDSTDEAVMDALIACEKQQISDPIPWLKEALKARSARARPHAVRTFERMNFSETTQ